jgi:hypothetical protein
MIRFAWVQARTQMAVAVAALAATAILAAVTGPRLLHFYDAVAGLLSLILTWWFSPIDRVQMNQLSPAMFGVRGITPIGYAAFAFALGVTAGVLIRRTIPAMAVTIVVFTGARMAFSYWVRPYLITPLRVTSALVMPIRSGAAPNPGAGAVKPGDLVVSDQVINGAGRVIGQNGGIGPNGELAIRVTHGAVGLEGLGGTCPNKFPALGQGALGGGVRDGGPPPAGFYAAVQDCVNRLGIRNVVTYQPLSRYWPLQWDETLIFTGLAIVLAGVSFWQVRRRLTGPACSARLAPGKNPTTSSETSARWREPENPVAGKGAVSYRARHGGCGDPRLLLPRPGARPAGIRPPANRVPADMGPA